MKSTIVVAIVLALFVPGVATAEAPVTGCRTEHYEDEGVSYTRRECGVTLEDGRLCTRSESSEYHEKWEGGHHSATHRESCLIAADGSAVAGQFMVSRDGVVGPRVACERESEGSGGGGETGGWRVRESCAYNGDNGCVGWERDRGGDGSGEWDRRRAVACLWGPPT